MKQTEKTETTLTESSISKPDSKNSMVFHKTFKSFLLSRKLWATLLSLGLLWFMYWKQIDYLYSFATYEETMASVLIPAFITLTRDVMVCFTAIIGAYLGIQGLVQWKHGTESVVSQATEFVKEKRDENINIKEERIEKIEHVYVEGDGGPERKPFGRIDDSEKYDY